MGRSLTSGPTIRLLPEVPGWQRFTYPTARARLWPAEPTPRRRICRAQNVTVSQSSIRRSAIVTVARENLPGANSALIKTVPISIALGFVDTLGS